METETSQKTQCLMLKNHTTSLKITVQYLKNIHKLFLSRPKLSRQFLIQLLSKNGRRVIKIIFEVIKVLSRA